MINRVKKITKRRRKTEREKNMRKKLAVNQKVLASNIK
jgi:hypothetical protein